MGSLCGGGNEGGGWRGREIGEARMAVGTVLGVAEEMGESEIGEAKAVAGAVVVAVGLERAVMAEEEGAGETGGWKRLSPGGGIFVAGKEEGVAVLKGLLLGGQMVLSGCRRKE